MPRTNNGKIPKLFENNRKWVESVTSEDPEYFTRLAETQKPEYLWIGCADSRVMAEVATGLKAGDLFVHRNVGNVLSHSDFNAMSALEYSVKALGVRHVFVVGHTNCGAVKAALTLPASSSMITNGWISQIREVRNDHAEELAAFPAGSAAQIKRLVHLNVSKQVVNVCTSPVVQQMWEQEENVFVHGMVYDVATGILKQIAGPVGRPEASTEDVEEAMSDLAVAEEQVNGDVATRMGKHANFEAAAKVK